MSEPVYPGPAVLRRGIGRRLQELRKRAGLTLAVAEQKSSYSEATLIRMENGVDGVRFQEPLVKDLLDVYGASEDEKAELLLLTAATRATKTRSWWHNYTKVGLPGWFGLYVSLEDSAETISQYEPELIPGLLQTRGYATQIMSVPTDFIDPGERERRVEVRITRQSLLTRARAPKVDVVLSQAALNRVVGMGPELAQDQLQHLLDVTQKANVVLRIVPWTAGVHAGMASGGGFNILHFPIDPTTSKPIEPTMAYVDSLTGAMYLAEEAEVTSYLQVWDDLAGQALSPEDSRHLITTTLEGPLQ